MCSGGMEVRVAIKDLAGRKFSRQVKKIAPNCSETLSHWFGGQIVNVTVRLSERRVASLHPGLQMDVTFITGREEGRLVVPKTALFNYEDKSAVWVVRRGKAEIQSVETGLETDDEVVVVSGLVEGDMVIRNTRLDGLKLGARIKI